MLTTKEIITFGILIAFAFLFYLVSTMERASGAMAKCKVVEGYYQTRDDCIAVLGND